MKIRQRILSMLIAFCMTTGIISVNIVDFAAATINIGDDAIGEQAGITVSYNFSAPAGTLEKGIKGYGDTKGAWKSEQSYPVGLSTNQEFRSYGMVVMTKALNQWVALRIRVPVAGTYSPVLKYSKYVSGGTGKVYILDGETTNIADSISSVEALGTVDYYATALTTGQEAYLSNVSFETAGEYILVFCPYEKGPASYLMYPSGLVLNGGDGIAPIHIEATSQKSVIRKNQTTQIQLSGFMSDGTDFDANGISVDYSSSDTNIAEVSTSGEVTGISPGSATISVAIESAPFIKSTCDIIVNDKELSGGKIVYNFNMLDYYNGNVTDVKYPDARWTWEYHSRSHENVGLVFTRINPIYGISVGTRLNQWLAFKIRIPESGIYSAALTHARDTTGGIGNVYLMDIDSDIAQELVNTTPLGTVDYYAPSLESGFETYLGDIEIEEAGEYLVVFHAAQVGPVGAFNFLTQLTLDGGDGALPVHIEAKGDNGIVNATTQNKEIVLAANETCNLFVSGYMSDGEKTLFESVDLEYQSSNTDVATVSSSGVVTAVSNGNATITLSIDSGDSLISDFCTVEVGEKALSGYQAKYDFIMPDYYEKSASDVTYYESNGAWEYYASNPPTLSMPLKSYGIVVATKAANQWAAYKIRVPAAGVYNTEITYTQYVSGGVGKVYIMDTDVTDISSSLLNSECLGEIDYYGSELVRGKVAYLNKIQFDKAGEYLIVFCASEKGEASYVMYPSSVTLNGGDNKTLNYLKSTISKNVIGVNKTCEVQSEGYMSDGSIFDLSQVSVKYISSDESVASVSTSGVVTGVGSGVATITASVPESDTCMASSNVVNVVAGAPSGYQIDYNLNIKGSFNGSVTDVKFPDSKGTWQFDSKSDNIGESGIVFDSNGINISGSQNEWAAFKIRIPVSGSYSATLIHSKHTSGTIGEVYILPVISEASNGFEEASSLGMVDFHGSASETGAKTRLSDIEIPEAGEYLLVFRLSENGSILSSQLELYGGEKIALMSAELENNKNYAWLSNGFLSDGSPHSLEGADISYYCDSDTASIDIDTGKITSYSEGQAIITAVVALDGITISTQKSATFESPDMPSNKNVTYYMSERSLSWTPEYSQVTNDVRGIPYRYTNGNWRWCGIGPAGTVSDSNTMHMYSPHNSASSTRTMMNIPNNKWLALTIMVPAAGRYITELEYVKYYSGMGIHDVYIIPSPIDEDEETLTDALPLAPTDINDIINYLTEENYLGSIDSMDDSSKSLTEFTTELGEVTLPSAGKYLLVFKTKKAGRLFLRNLTLKGENIIKYARFNLSNQNLMTNETATTSVSAYLFDGTRIAEDTLLIKYASNNEAVASITSDGIITAHSDGEAVISATLYNNGKSVEVTEKVYVSDISGVSSVELIAPETLGVDDNGLLILKANMNSGKSIIIPPELITYEYECEPDNTVTIENNEYISVKHTGQVRIRARAEFKNTDVISDYIIINITTAQKKKEPSYFTVDMRLAAQQNVGKYDWAKASAENAKKAVEKYIDNNLELTYSLIVGEGIPRSQQLGVSTDPNYRCCKYCGTDVYAQYTYFSIDMLNNPWKIKCPNCKRSFPSNDFGSLYGLGLDEHGYYNLEKAYEENNSLIDNGKEGYLINKLYPEKGEGWGVDDGYGYLTGHVFPNGTVERHPYIAYYIYHLWDEVEGLLNNLIKAYVYTGEEKYGRSGAIIIDRIADFYPGLYVDRYGNDYSLGNGGSIGEGKIKGRIADSASASIFAQACDAFSPSLEDAQVIKFLSNKADKYKLENKKLSSQAIWKNWEEGILKEIFTASKTADIFGNYGLQQYSVASAAITLDKEPESTEMIEWLYKTGTRTGKKSCTGGNISSQLVDVIDRDGMGDESSPFYNISWPKNLLSTADALSRYSKKPEYNLFNNPKYIKMFIAYAPLTLVGNQTAQIGDSSATARAALDGDPNMFISAFLKINDDSAKKILANEIYVRNNKSVEGLHYDIFAENPEKLKNDILKYIDDDLSRGSEMLSGYGFAVLRSGKRIDSVGINATLNNQSDFWIYFGGASTHKHQDYLNLGIEAFGLNMAPELGYPEQSTLTPNRTQWISNTLSHNTVMVNEARQNAKLQYGFPKHFNETDRVRLMDIDASFAYAGTNIYRRTVVMVKANEDVSYGVDFFRVDGGSSHIYSFHSQSNNIFETEGLSLEPQVNEDGVYVGSYAGAEAEFGPDPDTINGYADEKLRYPYGFTWLKKVRRSADVGNKFAVDFKVTDFRRTLNSSSDLHLRMTMLNDFRLSEVALAAGPIPVRTSNQEMPDTLEFVLAKREGNNLDSLFTTVFEPYKDKRYIKDMNSVDIAVIDGTEDAHDKAKAVKVTHSDGRVDYIMYATNNHVLYGITDGNTQIEFRGFVGVYSMQDGKKIYSYLHDGDILGDTTGVTNAFTGTIADFEHELKLNNHIKIKPDLNTNPDDIVGKYIFIDNDGIQNAAYKIEGANVLPDGSIELDIGTVTLIRGFRDSNNFDMGYIYNINIGQKYRIPNSLINDTSPIFTPVSNKYVDVNSQIRTSVTARSPIDKELTFSATILPRGATFDPETRTLSWTPEPNQTGDNLVAIKAHDGYLETTEYFTITVLGATVGGGGTTPGGGSGSPEDSETPSLPNKPSDPSQPVEPVQPTERFIDLTGFDWARNDILSLAEADIIQGTGWNTFSPGKNITRADFAILLVRAMKLTSESSDNFCDVSSGAYYADYLAIAKDNEIINGVGENKYNPTGEISRQDMMVIIARAIEKLNYETEEAGEEVLQNFDDAADISDYAKPAMATLVKNGIVLGDNKNIYPMDYATRAEVAVLLQRILKLQK